MKITRKQNNILESLGLTPMLKQGSKLCGYKGMKVEQ